MRQHSKTGRGLARVTAFVGVTLAAQSAMAQETAPPAAEPTLFAAGWWILLVIAVASVAFGGWVWWSYRGKK
jgi:hypothetical protein